MEDGANEYGKEAVDGEAEQSRAEGKNDEGAHAVATSYEANALFHGFEDRTGGFGMNALLAKVHIPLANSHISVQPPENTGDGLSMAVSAGGILATDTIDNCTWTPVSDLRDR